MTLESAMKRLEKISEMLESGELPLEKSLKLYEEANSLISFCDEQIKHAKLVVEELSQQNKQVIDGE